MPQEKRKNLRLTVLTVFLMTFFSVTGAAPVIENLLTEYTQTPLGIDVNRPRFSWNMSLREGQRGQFQSAWRIQVKQSDGKLVWDSHKVESAISVGIEYAGEPLQPTTRYDWTVEVWDQSGESALCSSWFETGLMDSDPGLSAWDGARWIGGGDEDLVLYSHYLSVFKVEFTLQLDMSSGSTGAGFILGANDSRLMDKNMNILGQENNHNDSYVKFELDISDVDGSDAGVARLNIYRVGYHPDDRSDKPLQSLDIPSSKINRENKYEPHNISIESVFGTLTLSVDDARLAASGGQTRGSFRGGGININPMGSGGDYIAFPMLADIGFSVNAGQKARFTNVIVRHYRKPSNVLFHEDLASTRYNGIYSGFIQDGECGLSVNEGAYEVSGGNKGSFITADPSQNSMPMLRTEFMSSKGKIAKARLYITARGVYEIYLNGQKIGDDFFNPGLTQYNLTHMYQTYDVTGLVKEDGVNAMGAALGEGWWSGNYTFTGGNWNFFGDRQSLLAKLVITYDDGTSNVIVTDDKNWKYFNNGPVVYGSFFQGEVYDARREEAVLGWCKAGFNDRSWKNAQVVPLEETAFLGSSPGIMGGGPSISYESLKLTGQIGETVRVIKTLKAQSVTEVRPGVFVYDMGQNMVGIPDITIANGKKGKKITVRYAEVLYPDLKAYEGNVGMVMLENLRAAHVQDLYILKDGTNEINPHFTFHGYRYVEITGIDKALPLDAVSGKVLSSIHELTADYKSSNDRVNRLWQNIVWSEYGNFLSIPTDCPQRNERMGWSGDINVFSRTATYLANVDQFFRRHMIAMRDMQGANGRFTDVAPVGGGFGGILWGSAGITLAWEAFLQYGDTALLREHYDAMASYADYMDASNNKETGISSDAILGDWLGPQNNLTGSAILTTAYQVFDLDIMVKCATLLGKTDDISKWYDQYNERQEFFNRKFVNEDHRTINPGGGFSMGGGQRPGDPAPGPKLSDTQSSYAVGLALGAFNDENKKYATEYLGEACRRENIDDNGVTRPSFSLMTGFIGTAWISKALSDNGYSETAYNLLQQTSYPSWLYPVEQGATTIWERLNSYTVEDGFGGNNSMNSFNHYSFGAVGQWLMAYSLGIQRDEPGFRKFILQPEPDPTGQMTWAQGSYKSMYGTISSSWNVADGKLTYKATVPANTTATLYLPAASSDSIRESGRKPARVKGANFLEFRNGSAVFELSSGTYTFTSTL